MKRFFFMLAMISMASFLKAQNLITNGDFASGFTGFTSGLAQSCTCFPATYCVVPNNAQADKCPFFDNTPSPTNDPFLVVDGFINTAPGNPSFWRQDSICVVEGEDYTFSIDVMGVFNNTLPDLEIVINGNAVFVIPGATLTIGVWNNYSFIWTAPIGTTFVTIGMEQTTFPGFVASDYGIDNISFIGPPCGAVCPCPEDEDWLTTAGLTPMNIMDDIYTEGLVGVNTINPVGQLHVEGAVGDNELILESSNANPDMLLAIGGNSKTQIRYNDQPAIEGLQFRVNDNFGGYAASAANLEGVDLFIDGNTNLNTGFSNIGIGTNNPSQALHVNGNGRFQDLPDANNERPNFDKVVVVGSLNDGTLRWRDVSTLPGGADADWDVTTSAPDMFSIPTGNVGIGVTAPTARLDIDGNIRVNSATPLGNTVLSDAASSGQIIMNGTAGQRLNLQNDAAMLEFFADPSGSSRADLLVRIAGLDFESYSTGTNALAPFGVNPAPRFPSIISCNEASVGTDAQNAVIAGGQGNAIGAGSFNNAILGGLGANIGQTTDACITAGGAGLNIGAFVARSALIAGENNFIADNTFNNAILAGQDAQIQNGANTSAIIGGQMGLIASGANNSVILGGNGLTATDDNRAYTEDLNINGLLDGENQGLVLTTAPNGDVILTCPTNLFPCAGARLGDPQIDDLTKRIEELEAIIASLGVALGEDQGEVKGVDPIKVDLSTAAILYQNTPNPFGINTEIRFYVPQSTDQAKMVFYDSFGRVIREVEVTGTNRVEVSAADLAAGMYTYSLIVDGRVIDTKKMIKE